jgi:glucose/arabinose dehydrogenase
MKTFGCVLAACAAAAMATAQAQTPLAKPAFPGQTNAPPPSRPSPPFTVETITNRLSSPWSVAFLPDGNFLVTESVGAMRIIRPDGFVSLPIAGVPGVKVVGAQGLHDVVLDPDFARNRTLYVTTRPPRGEAPACGRSSFSTNACGRNRSPSAGR